MSLFNFKYCRTLFLLLAAISILIFPSEGKSELIIRTHGHFTVAPFVHGFNKSEDVYPGYRSEFISYVDLFNYRSTVFNILTGNTTMIDRYSGQMKMDRIRYLLAPGLRYEYGVHLLKFTLNHECIHNISRPEYRGSTWWNSFQLGFGSRGSYYLYLPAKYAKTDKVFLKRIDYQVNAGLFIPANSTIFTGQNHEYKQEFYYLLRYQLGMYKKAAFFTSFRHHIWFKKSGWYDEQIEITINVMQKGIRSYSGFFYSYRIKDTFNLDSSEGLGSVGLKILF